MSLAIVVPTYNEAENIEAFIDAVLTHSPATLIIVDDASPDGTANRIKAKQHERIHLLERKGKRGLGSAYLHGFTYALDQGFQTIGQMDADFSHAPHAIEDLYKSVQPFSLSMGSRYIPKGGIEGWNLWRHFCSRSAILASRMYLGIPSKDITSGFRLWDRALLEAILQQSITSSGYAFQEELLFHAHRLGGQVYEVPITFKDREHGKSKLGLRDILGFFFLLLQLRYRYGRLS